MRRLLLYVLLVLGARVGLCQSYNIATFAGGGLPANIPASSASIFEPFTIAADQAGNVFLVNGNTVLRWDKTKGVMTLVVGNGASGDGGDNGPPTLAQLNKPEGLAVDSAGNLYISDSQNRRVRKVANGIITTIAGSGAGGYPRDGMPATAAPLAWPSGLAVDSQGSVYVADTVAGRVYRISNDIISTFAGNQQGPVASGDNGPATMATLFDPQYLALDAAGNLYISDIGTQSVRKVSNGIITTVAGNGIRGYSGDNGPAASASLSNPAGIAVDSAGTLYIADTSNSRIRAVSGGVITTVIGTGPEGFSGDAGPAISAGLNLPEGIALDAAGDLFIADGINYRVRQVAKGVITTIIGNGWQNFGGLDGPATSAQIYNPAHLAADLNGGVYFDQGLGPESVLGVTDGILSIFAGTGQKGFSGDNGPAASAQLSGVAGIAADSTGNLYISDIGRIREVSHGIIRTIAGTGVSGSSGDNSPALQAQVLPSSLALDAAGNIFFMNILFPNPPSLREISNGVVTTLVSGDVLAFKLVYGGTNLIYGPGQIAVDSAGSVYLPDYYRCVVDKVSKGVVTRAVGSGTCGFDGDNGPALHAALLGPSGVAIDGAGALYISEEAGHRLRKVSGGVIATIAGNGTEGFSGDGGPATAAELDAPADVAVDQSGNVYVADRGNNRIRILAPNGPPCTYSLSPTPVPVAAPPAGSVVLRIQTAPSCAWAASNLPAWITAGVTGGTGTATLTLTIVPNAGVARSATISAAGIDVPVTQLGAVPSIFPGGIVNAASSAGSAAAPGSLISIYGDFLSVPNLSAPSSGPPRQLGGISVQFGSGPPAPLLAVSSGQINVQVPWELANQSAASVTVTVNGLATAPSNMKLAPFSPGIFAMNGQGTGQGAVLDPSYALVDASNPAAAGSTVIQIFCTGLGPVTNQPATGSPGLAEPLSWTTATPIVTIGGADATVQYSGLAPGLVGVYQVNALVPTGSAKGPAIPVTLKIGGLASNPAGIAVR